MTGTSAGGKVWTAANALMGLMFVFSVAVQVNDPDPLVWMAIYGMAAVVCVLEAFRRTRLWVPAAVGLPAVVWAATIAPRVLGVVPIASMFEEFEMKNIGVEESREMYGLLIVAAWMVAIQVAAVRRRMSGQGAQGAEHQVRVP